MNNVKIIRIIIAILGLLLHNSNTLLETEETRQIVSSHTRFTSDLYRSIAKDAGTENLFFSPQSIYTVLGMLYLGTGDSNTKQQMRSSLYFNSLEDPSIHSSMQYLRESLNNTRCILHSANRLVAQDKHPITDSYLQGLENYYGTDFVEADFQKNSENVRLDINNWVSEHTNGMIENLIPSGGIGPETVLVLINAIYFKGIWLSQFNEADTNVDYFHVNDVTSIPVQLMYQKGKFNLGYSDDLRSKILELPYADESMSMFVVLPNEIDGIELLQKKFALSKLHSIQLYKETTEVYLPKFKFEKQFDLKSVLSKLGMNDMFNSNRCDLSGIDGSQSLYVSQVFHKAYISVNEEGSEAAAATAATIVKRSVSKPPSIFVADHPFVFYIRDNRTRNIVFLGQLVQPDIVQTSSKDEL